MANADRSYRLLIVDDDETDRRFYHRLLTGQPNGVCEIRQAADGAAGLAALREQVPDCVLLDFSLPDVTGLEFLTDAAVDGALPCAVVLITGAGSEAIAVAAMKHGVQDYLVKDQLTVRSLWSAITNAVAQTELRQLLDGSLLQCTTSNVALAAANAALQQEAAIRQAAEADLRRAKEAAEQADAAKTRFIAMVTHELRTPLNGILGYAELLRIEGQLSPAQEARVAAMLLAGRHLREMIETVLDVAATDTGQIVLHPAPVAIREVTEGCIGCVGPMATKRRLGLRLVSAHDAPRQIITDPARLRQVLVNLLGNAVKYTDAGSAELRVLAGAIPGGVRFEVADTGPGIDTADRERLFRDFERLDANASTEGAGLGLAIAARLVNRMGGTIGHAPNPGGGSIFWLELPPGEVALPQPPFQASPAPPPRLPATPPWSPPPSLLPGHRVLLVDDNPMNHDVIGAFLRAAGHTVVLADNGEQAVRLADEQTFDLILMDLRMPDLDGLQATQRIRALPALHGKVPILALTACTFRDQVEQCRQAGMDGHIAKPVDYATLMAAVAAAITAPASRWTGDPDASPETPVAPGQPTEPTLDRAALDATLAFLTPDEAASSLRSLRECQKQMLRLLDQPATPAELTQAAHSLASNVGMFGFAALCAVARNFEHAMACGAPEADRLGQLMRAEIDAGLTALDALVHECHLQPA